MHYTQHLIIPPYRPTHPITNKWTETCVGKHKSSWFPFESIASRSRISQCVWVSFVHNSVMIYLKQAYCNSSRHGFAPPRGVYISPLRVKTTRTSDVYRCRDTVLVKPRLCLNYPVLGDNISTGVFRTKQFFLTSTSLSFDTLNSYALKKSF